MAMPSAAAFLLSAAVLAGCASPSESPPAERVPSVEQQGDRGRLTARPGRDGGRCAPGERWLELGSGRRALMRVTAGGRGGRKGLILALHGAGSGGSRGGLYVFRGGWDEPGVVLIAPAAEGTTWSFLRGRDTDLPFVDRALARAFARCRVDPRRIAVGGFSDGATYALALGLANGDLFRAIMALSPGGAPVDRTVGKPRVFIAHGTLDGVLPLARTSGPLVRELREAGYRVTFRQFRGGHRVLPEVSREAVRWFTRS
jgi:phospholipase/carboxylesterase